MKSCKIVLMSNKPKDLFFLTLEYVEKNVIELYIRINNFFVIYK